MRIYNTYFRWILIFSLYEFHSFFPFNLFRAKLSTYFVLIAKFVRKRENEKFTSLICKLCHILLTTSLWVWMFVAAAAAVAVVDTLLQIFVIHICCVILEPITIAVRFFVALFFHSIGAKNIKSQNVWWITWIYK